jgi:DNA-binding transcriptional MerR regulator/mannose-6-phosphate isomerase-like protein (cupin superfamily)
MPAHAGNGAGAGAVNGVYIRQAAEMVGASTSSLRMWEQFGLLSPQRTPSGYRVYTLPEIERLRRIRDLVDEGINLAGVKHLLDEESAAALPRTEAGKVQTTDSVGRNVRTWRVRHEMTLRQVSDLTGLSPSYISAIERCIASPSIASLQKLATAFGTNVLTLLGESYQAPATPITRVGERPILESSKGVTIEDCSTAETNLEPLLFVIQPGCGSDGPLVHEGEEFLYVMEGELRLRLDGVDDYDLKRGDSMAYNSMRQHQFSNHGDVLTVVIWVNTPRTF